MRIVFMGSSDFAIRPLEAIAEAHEIVCVYSQPARAAGRGKRAHPTPVARWAQNSGLAVRCPADLRAPSVREELLALSPELAVVVSYGLIIPPGLLTVPLRGFLNIHPSLLPRWRGAAPIQRSIMEGDRETGVCIVEVVEELDAGPVLLKKKVPISDGDTALSLASQLSSAGAELMLNAISQLESIRRAPQQDEGVTYAKKIEKSEARVDWTRPMQEVDRHIRGLSPFPGAWSEMSGTRIRLLECRVSSGSGAPGEILDNSFTVACGVGAVSVRKVQRPGKQPVSASDFLRGFPVSKGNRFAN